MELVADGDDEQELTDLINTLAATGETVLQFENKAIYTVPSTIKILSSLTELRLANTHINSIPVELYDLSSLIYLDLSSTEIPMLGGEIQKLSKLEYLDVSGNKLPELPNQVSSLPLRTLKVQGNNFDRLPSTVSRISTLADEGSVFECHDNPYDEPFQSFQTRPYAMLAYLRGLLPMDEGILNAYFDNMISICEGALTVAESERINDFLEHHTPAEIEKYSSLVVDAMILNSAPRYLIPPPDFADVLMNIGLLQSEAKRVEKFIIEITSPKNSGWLVKRGGRRKNWKKRFFILQFGYLFYFKAPEDYEPKGAISLYDVDEVSVDLSRENKRFGFKIATKYRTFRIHATSDDQREVWLKTLTDVTAVIGTARKIAEFIRMSGNERCKAFWISRLARNDAIRYKEQVEFSKWLKKTAQEEADAIEYRSSDLLYIPEEFFALYNLVHVDLSNNHLTFLPKEFLCLDCLIELIISNNDFVDIPIIVFYIKNLEVLDFSNNSISGIPSEVCALKYLKSLNLAGNLVHSVPVELARLKNLETLLLEDNIIETLPAELSLLSSLTVLRLDRNKISVLPHMLEGLPQLAILSLLGNKIQKLECNLSKMGALFNLEIDIKDIRHKNTQNVDTSDLSSLIAALKVETEDFTPPESPPQVLIPKWPIEYFGPVTLDEEKELERRWMGKMEDERLENLIVNTNQSFSS